MHGSSDTFQDIDALHREIDRAFENLVPFTGPFARMAFLPGRLRAAIPLVNVHEDKDRLYVEADGARVDPASMNISSCTYLTISGEKKKGAPDEIKPEAFIAKSGHAAVRGAPSPCRSRSTTPRSGPNTRNDFCSSSCQIRKGEAEADQRAGVLIHRS